MNKCLKITFTGDFLADILADFIQKNARKLSLEGTVRIVGPTVSLIACGLKESVDAFVDLLYKGSSKFSLAEIEIEPFIKDKDYRGVFRVIG